MNRSAVVAGNVLALSCLAAAVAGCGPPTRALIGVSAASADPVVTLFVCDAEPHLTVRVYTGSNPQAFYTLTGRARRRETVRVPLTVDSPNWRLTGKRTALPVGSTIEADSEDGSGKRLGSAVYFKLEGLPSDPLVGVGDDRLKLLSAAAFTRTAERTC